MQFVAYTQKVLFARRQTIAKQNVSRKWREMFHMLYIVNMKYIKATRYLSVHKLIVLLRVFAGNKCHLACHS